ncbi:MAG: T9SS C-terminal target domain-containing protein [Calditrichaeota bacterium]|nr:T9SS type A sorting domain-containing protein [Calditrichota bacterium]RQW03951.1 MAG: T9SS C-terminal target domain-containing protein [Calditrichota bacterium]
MRTTLLSGFIMLFISHSFLSGGTWQREIVDSSGTDTGWYCSLALDSNNDPHIAYSDADNFDLHYAYFKDGEWHIDLVDSIGVVGFHCDLVLDENDRPHIAYQKGYYAYAVTDVGLKYATITDTGWAKVYIDSTRFGIVDLFCSIAFRPDGTPGIAYIDIMEKRLKFAYKSGDEWKLTDINDASAGASIGFCKLVFKSDGTPVIGYTHDSLMIAVGDPAYSNWTTTTIPYSLFTLAPSSELNMDIDSQDNIHMTMLHISPTYQYELLYLHYDWQSWQDEIILPEGVGNVSLKIDNNDIPCIVTGLNDVLFFKRENNQWVQSVIDDNISEKAFSSLNFDNNNIPHLAFQGKPSYSQVDAALLYYRYYPGAPQINLPVGSHDFGLVSTQSYIDWNCPITNTGQGPLIITDLRFQPATNSFQIINTPLPIYIQPTDTAYMGIRFQPEAEQTYQITLQVHSNDTLNSPAPVNLTGQGTSSGNTGDLNLHVRNGYYDQTNGYLKSDIPWSGGQVNIYQNSQLVSGPHTTPADGILNLSSLPVGNLQFRLEKDFNLPDGTGQEHITMNSSLELGPGSNSHTLVFPESLMVYKYELIHALTHIENDFFGVPANYSYGNSEDKIKAVLQSWNSNLPDDVAENLARLILVEKMVHDMFGVAEGAGNELMQDLGDLIGFIFYAESWGASIIQLLLAVIQSIGNPSQFMYELLYFFIDEVIKAAIMQGVGFAIDQMAALVPPPGPELIKTGWRQVKSQYSGMMGGAPFGDNGWAEAKRTVFKILEYPFFQLIYIDMLSSSTLDKAKNRSENFNYNGTFHQAHLEQGNFVSWKRTETELLTDLARGFRISANLFMVSANIFDWLGTVVPGFIGTILQQISFYAKISAYVNVVTAFGLSAGGFFSVPVQMEDAVDDIYLPDGSILADHVLKPRIYARAEMPEHQLTAIKSSLFQAVTEYDSMINDIKQNIQNGNSEHAAGQLRDLWQVEGKLNNNFQLASAPIYSVANIATDSIDSFDEVYDSLRVYCAYAVEARTLNYLNVAGAAIDNSQEVRDSVFKRLDNSIQLNHQFADQVFLTLDTVTAHLEIPAVVMVSYTQQEKLRLQDDETSIISVRIKNVGSLIAENVSIILETNEALRIHETDSITIGSLAPGEESDMYTWTVSVFDRQYPKGVWDAVVYSPNSQTYSASGTFTIVQPESPPTGGKLSSDNIYNYPNPFNPERETTTLRYSLEKSGNVSVKIFDSGGNLVKILMEDVSQSASVEQSVIWDGKNGEGELVANGVYFFRIETSQDERAVGKIAVLR